MAGGRPRKDKHETRSKVVAARYTLSEYEHLRQQVYLAGLPDLSEFQRRRTLGYEVPSGESRRVDPAVVTELNRLALEVKDLRRELAAIGNNANQLALSTNSGRRFRASWQDVRDRITELGTKAGDVLEEATHKLERIVIGDP